MGVPAPTVYLNPVVYCFSSEMKSYNSLQQSLQVWIVNMFGWGEGTAKYVETNQSATSVACWYKSVGDMSLSLDPS